MPPPINDEENTPTAEEILAQETAAAIARGDVAASDDDADDKSDETGKGTDEEDIDTNVDDDATKALKDELDEGEEKPADKGAAAETDDEKKPKNIPLDRHTKILNKERDARIAAEDALKKASKTSADSDHDVAVAKQEKVIEELETVYSQALIDADAKLAASTMTKIRRLDRELSDARSTRQAAATESRAVESTRYDMLVSRIEAEYPELNPDHEDFDEDIAAEVMELKNAFVASGSPPSAALNKAMKYALTEDNASAEKEDEADPAKAEAAKAERKAAGIAKKAKAAAKTPPNTEKVGLSSDKLGGDGKVTAADIGKLSQAQFAKLSEKELAAARGDVI